MKHFQALFFITLLAFVSKGQTWNFQAPMSISRGQHGVVSHPNGKAYIFGGFAGSTEFNSLEIYDAGANTWSLGAPIPINTRGMAFALGPDSNIYCFGGYNISGWVSDAYKYNTVTDTWTPLASMPTPTWECAAAAINGKIYIFGGENAQSLVQIYDPVANTYSAGASIPTPVQQHSCVAANGKIYLMGGYNGPIYDLVQIYDPVGNSWTTGAVMPAGRNQFAIMRGPDGMIYAVGGKMNYGNNSSPFFTTTFIYDPVGNSWTTGPNMPKGLGETEGCTIGNSIYVFAGADSTFGYSNVALKMDVQTLGSPYKDNGVISIYPNPADDQLSVRFDGSVAGETELNIFDLTGKSVHRRLIRAFENSTEVIDIRELQAGIYFVSIISGDVKITQKLIIK